MATNSGHCLNEHAGHPAQHDEIGKGADRVGALELAGDSDRQALEGELVDDAEHRDIPTTDNLLGSDTEACEVSFIAVKPSLEKNYAR